MKKAFKFSQSFVWIFAFYAVLALALLAPISSTTMIPNVADMINHLGEIIQAKAAILSGQFPLRMAPMWGYPVYQFYSPSTYLFAGLIYAFITPKNPLIAYQIVTWTGLLIGGVYLYRVAFWFTQKQAAALLAGVVYMAAPYMIICNFRIGDINEGIALGILPAALFYTLKYFYKPQQINTFLLVGLTWYLLMTTHLVTFVLASFFIGLLLFLMTLRNSRYWHHLLRVGVAYFSAYLLAMWYLGPVIFFEKYLFVGDTYAATNYLTANTPFLANLFSSVALITKGSTSAIVTLHPALGWPILIAFGVGAYAFFNKLKSGNRRIDYWLPILFSIFLLAFMMTWSPVNIWKFLPHFLWIAQYSWRLLGQVMWVGALLFAWSICWLFKNRLDLRHVIIGTFLIMSCANPWFVSNDAFRVSLADFTKNPFLVYNNNAYLLNFIKYPNFVSSIDNLAMNTGDFSILKIPVEIAYPLLKIADKPILKIKGNVTHLSENTTVQVFSNHVLLGSYLLRPGKIDWQISLPAFSSLPNTDNQLAIHFVNPKSWGQGTIDSMMLTGFVQPHEIFDLTIMRKACTQKKQAMVCELNVPVGVKQLELPVYFYPGLLKITLNGESVAYRGILNNNVLVTEITPKNGMLNTIHIRFTGFVWANIASFMAWMGWLFLFFFGQIKWIFLKEQGYNKSL